MNCTMVEKYFRENGCSNTILPEALQQHLVVCDDCRLYYRFVAVLELQQGPQKKAPADILPNVEKRIFESMRIRKEKHFPFPAPLFKPAVAGFFALMVAAAGYSIFVDKNAGHVENLSARFKIEKFETFKSGDILYAGDNSTVVISLKGRNRVQIHQNTIIKVNDTRRISLSRGALSLETGAKEFRVATPDGLLLASNTTAKIMTISRLERGAVKTETTCMVFKGKLVIKSAAGETILDQGQKAVMTENGKITGLQQLAAAESGPHEVVPVKQKLFAAVELLCDCITAMNYTPGRKADHLQLFGKEVDENKFKVRVFWEGKGLKELAVQPSNENKKQYSITITKIGRIRA